MKENKLIASLVVFKELYDSNTDIYKIISEFIKASVITQKKWTFNATSISKSVDEVFNFNIPVAVIKSAIKKHLIPINFINYSKGEYTVNNINEKISDDFKDNYNLKTELYDKTIFEFVKYIEQQNEKKLNDKELICVKEDIVQYLLGNENNGLYVKEISKFIVIKKNDQKFRKHLNVIKEGLVLYTGIQYTSDLNELGYWKKELTIFLDTNIIFNLNGYSGKVYTKIFNDFLNLVKEINNSQKTDIIHLKYFEETEKEINEFFSIATSIFSGINKSYPSASAMKSIINGCDNKSDILMKRIQLFNHLENLNIQKEDEADYYQDYEYVVEGSEVVGEIKEILRNRNYKEEKILKYLKLFTKVNVLRQGVNNMGFDNSKFILLTSSGFVNFLAHSKPIKQNQKDIPFATSLDFITDKFWFKLKKGFSNKSNLPLSFDFVTKAQIILSAHIDNTVEEKYTTYQEKLKKGEISIEDTRAMAFELRSLTIKPEDLTELTVDDALSSIDEYSYDNYIREKEETNFSLKKGEIAINKLKSIDRLDRTKRTKNIKLLYKIFSFLIYLSIAFLLGSFIYLSYYLFLFLLEETDSKLSVFSFIIGLFAPIIGIYKFGKKIRKKINTKIINHFRERIEKIIK